MKVVLLGEEPFESIESVNFYGDKYYNKPHIFCHFDFKEEPCRRLFYGEEFQLRGDFPYSYRELQKNSKQETLQVEVLGSLTAN